MSILTKLKFFNLRVEALPLMVLAMMILGSWWLSDIISEHERSYAKLLSSIEATRIQASITAQKDNKITALTRMAQRWNVANGISLDLWHDDARNYLHDIPSLKALEWVDSTYHVRWVVSSNGSEKPLGLDIFLDKQRQKSLVGTEDENTPLITQPLNVIQGYECFTIYFPVRANGHFDGYIASVFSIKEFFNVGGDINLDTNFALAVRFAGHSYDISGVRIPKKYLSWLIEKPIQIFDQVWTLQLSATHSFVQSQQTTLPRIVLIAGLLISLLAALALHSVLISLYQARLLKASTKELNLSNSRNRQLINGVKDYAIYWLDLQGNIETWNSGAELINYYTAEEIIGINFSVFYTQEDQQSQSPQTALAIALEKGQFEGNGWRVRKDGTRFWANVFITPILDNNKMHVGFAKITRDITEKKRAEEERNKFELALIDSENRFNLAVEGMSVGVWDWKIKIGEMYWSKKLCQIFGIVDPEFRPDLDYFSNHLHPDDKEQTLNMLTGHMERNNPYNIEYRLQRPDGNYVWIHASGQAQWNENNEPIRMAGSVVDISKRKAYELNLFQQANHDTLTGLPNRRMFFDHMEHSLIRANRSKRNEVIMFLDVNEFKKINDTLGHEIGDLLLQQIASRLKSALRASDMVARYAGDEFVIHLDTESLISREVCILIAEKIAAQFEDPIIIDVHKIQSSVSIGIASYPEHGQNIVELIRKADEAMYVSKKTKTFALAG